MSRINPEVLRAERKRKGWSLDDLARRSGVDTQSIHRIEKGGQKHNRKDVITSLAKALGILEDILTGATAPSLSEKGMDELDELFSESQLNLRVSDQSRNALSLTASHYRVTLAQIVEIAPLLFCWAAEQSLKKRRERLAEIDKANDELARLRLPHVHAANFVNARSEEPLNAERQSVEKNDLFGKLIDGDEYESYLPDNYNEAADNPFAVFLHNLIGDCGDLAVFEEWEPDSSPAYAVCRSKAVEFVGGDGEAAEAILEGTVPLHKLPKELREMGKKEARAKWVRDEAAARLKKITEGIDLSDLGI